MPTLPMESLGVNWTRKRPPRATADGKHLTEVDVLSALPSHPGIVLMPVAHVGSVPLVFWHWYPKMPCPRFPSRPGPTSAEPLQAARAKRASGVTALRVRVDVLIRDNPFVGPKGRIEG